MGQISDLVPDKIRPKKSSDARGILRWAALFLGELRDGLTMINMQAAFLIASKQYSEKQAGTLFFVFGMSQFLAQTPAGYLMDYTDRKILWLSLACIATTSLTLVTAGFAQEAGGNLGFMVFVKFLQGAVTAFIPPGLNSITQGIVGSVGMTNQVAKNEMMNHLGTAIIVLCGSLIAYFLYPNIGLLFIVSPVACAGVLYFLNSIRPEDIDHDAARGLKIESATDKAGLGLDTKPSSSSMNEQQEGAYKPPAADAEDYGDGSAGAGASAPASPGNKKGNILTKPSFNFGFGAASKAGDNDPSSAEHTADTPLHVLRDPTLLTFLVCCFLFHLSNGTVLPLVMQTLALGEGQSGILLSGMCIIVAQLTMVAAAKICGDFSTRYGRKVLFLIGFFTVPVRCFILYWLTGIRDDDGTAPTWVQLLTLSTQIMDGVGAGTFGTMYILVTSDISGGTGRFSMTLGLTTAAMSIGGTVSGYLGQALAQDIGYREAFAILGFMSTVPCLMYLFCMPETLPDYARDGGAGAKQPELKTMTSIAEHDEEDGSHGGRADRPYVEMT